MLEVIDWHRLKIDAVRKSPILGTKSLKCPDRHVSMFNHAFNNH
jgi:hypothetical protein